MRGRKYRFTTPTGTLTRESTDFLVAYGSTGNPAQLTVTLKRVWETVAASAGYAQRRAQETRWETLLWGYRNKRGLLDIALQNDSTWSGTGSSSYPDVTLTAVNPNQDKKNGWIDYDLEFTMAASGASIARELAFGDTEIEYANFIVKYGRENRTQFKKPWRLAPILIPSGPGLKQINVTAIRQLVSASSDLARRQAVEAVIRHWAWDVQGTEAELQIDGVSLGVCHLQNVSPSSMDMLDAVAFELQFVSGFIQ